MSSSVTDLARPVDAVIDLRPLPAALDRVVVAFPAPVLAPADSVYLRLVKPAIDRVVAALVLVLVLPALAMLALAVRVSLGPGVLYRQQRVGYGGRPFTVLKFRTMLPDRRCGETDFAGTDRRVTHKTARDPRHTRLGRFLRASSLDELPQLVNVLRGEMSLVGPRPELPSVVRRYQPWEHTRHAVRPGLTGPWQVTARNDGPMSNFTDLDVEYVRSVSAATDLRILARTIPAVLWSQRGS